MHHVIHKDLKPDNILWNSTTNVAKIGDFGSATLFSFVDSGETTAVRYGV